MARLGECEICTTRYLIQCRECGKEVCEDCTAEGDICTDCQVEDNDDAV